MSKTMLRGKKLLEYFLWLFNVKPLSVINPFIWHLCSLSFTVSAPGKALIAGGYLVLEPSNIGITISSTSRFYSTVALLVSDSFDVALL
jgi:hypothetical protein